MTSLRGDIWAGLTTASRRSMMKCPACGEVVDTRVAVNVFAHMRWRATRYPAGRKKAAA
jgi:predicted RNA-binding Zn-ribbon protein involved in translation (DUF1610 family)